MADLLEIYKKNHWFFNSGNINFKFLDKSLVQSYRGKYGHIFYDYVYPEARNNKCKTCKEKSVLFLTFDKGYSNYCSKHCATKDPDRISERGKRIGIEKRNIAMKNLLLDPIRGKEYRQKISVKSKHYSNLPGARERQSIFMKTKIANGEFTPCITNTWTRWKCSSLEKKFRSSFEALFYTHSMLIENLPIQYEALRIPYQYNNKRRNYIVDFIDNVNKIAYEIKPHSLLESEINKIKIEALGEWCKANNYELRLISETQLMNMHRDLIQNDDLEIVQFFKEKYKWNL